MSPETEIKRSNEFDMSDDEFKRFMQFSKTGISGDAYNSVSWVSMYLSDSELIQIINSSKILTYSEYLKIHKPLYEKRTVELSDKNKILEFDALILRIKELIGTGVDYNDATAIDNIKMEIEKLKKVIYN